MDQLARFYPWLANWHPHAPLHSAAMWKRVAADANAKRIAAEKENSRLLSENESLRGEVAILQQQLDDCEKEITDGRPRNFPET